MLKAFPWYALQDRIPTENCINGISSSQRNPLKHGCHPCWQCGRGTPVGHLPYLYKQGWAVRATSQPQVLELVSYVHWPRSLSGTPRSLKELVTEQVLTTGTSHSKTNLLWYISGCSSRRPSWCRRPRMGRWLLWRWRLKASTRPGWTEGIWRLKLLNAAVQVKVPG